MSDKTLVLGLGNVLMGDLPDIHLITVNIEECRTVKIGLSEAMEEKLPEVHKTLLKILEELDHS